MEPRRSPLGVLLIDDDEDDYVLIRDLFSDLAGHRFELHWVSSYEAALEALQTGQYDLCLLDYRLDGRNGLDLMHEINRSNCCTPVIFLTGHGDFKLDLDVMQAGAADYLTKGELSASLLERSLLHAIERRQREEELLKARKVIQALSECNQAVIHIRDELELLQEICRIVVEVGGYRMAWVGYAQEDADQKVAPVAKCGYEEDYLETVQVTWKDSERGRGPTGTSIRTGTPSIFRFAQDRPEFSPWKTEAAKRNYAAAIGLPLLVEERSIGALTIYSEQADAFSGEEVDLLVKLSRNLSYGIEALRAYAARRHSEQELLESETKYRKLSQEFHVLLDAISDTLVLVSPDLKILWSNNANVYQLDTPVAEITGGYCYEMFYALPAPCEGCPVRDCFRTGEVETRVASRNGRLLDKRAFPIKEGDKVNSVILLVSDVTEKMAMQAEAMHTSHLASLGELAAGVAHEINNPINGIINYAQVLINECSPESLESDIGARIVKEGDRIADIVKSLLAFARGGREDKRSTRVGAILKESLILIQAQIRKEGIRLVMDVADDLPEINANFQKIQQVFLNIIHNARYALNEKYPARHADKLLEISGTRLTIDRGEYVRMTFYDRGVGIPAASLPMLTKPFFSTKPFGKGTGLGLAITHKIIADHGGRLAFESEEGEFTKVIVDLPAEGSSNG